MDSACSNRIFAQNIYCIKSNIVYNKSKKNKVKKDACKNLEVGYEKYTYADCTN